MTASEERAIRAERRALKRAERERRRSERAVRQLRRERIRTGGVIVFEPREPSYADLRGATFTHFCAGCRRWFKDESVFEHQCEFCSDIPSLPVGRIKVSVDGGETQNLRQQKSRFDAADLVLV